MLEEYRQAHNKRFAVAAQDTQPAWRQAPSDHTQLLDLCALHYVRKVYKSHTVRLHGRAIDIPKRPDAARATYAGKEVVVKHLLQATTVSFTVKNALRGPAALGRSLQQAVAKTTTRTNNWGDTFTEQLSGDIFTSL